MFTLLAPLALIASALLAIPVIIHLLKPKRVRVMPFSSLRWLRTSQHKLSRRIQWHQILLFILRAAFLIALVLALAKPIFSTSGTRLFTERFIILDVSRSMNYEQAGKDTPFVHGKNIARALLNQLMPGDRATVLLAGSNSTALGPLAEDPTRYAARLEAARAGLSDTDLSSALAVIRPMLATPRPNTRADIIFITDNHQGAWSQASVSAFTDGLNLPLAIKLIDVGPAAARNAWIADASAVEAESRRFLHVRLGASGSEPQDRTLRLKQLPEVAQKVSIAPGTFAEVDMPLPAGFDLQGQIAELLIEPRDALPHDDVFWLNLETSVGTRVLLLEPQGTQIETLQAGYHLRAALTVLGRAVQVTRRTPEAVIATDINNADVIIMANVPQLSDDRVLALETRIKAGAGMLMFFGPAVQASFYNTKLNHLLPRPLQHLTQTKGSLASLTRIAWTHPLLSPLFDPTFGDFARVQARSFYLFGDAAKDDTSQTLAWFDEAAPALIEHSVGAGRVLIVNSSANDEWSDLPRRNSFVPFIDQALNRLARARLSSSFHTGELIALALPGTGRNTSASVTSPTGRSLTPIIQQLDAQAILRLDDADETGVYSVKAKGDEGKAEFNFVVQAGRGDSTVAKTDTDTLRFWWGKAEFEVTHPDPNAPADQALVTGRVLLWPWLIALAALVLMAEMYFVHRLCPVMNPAVADSSVAQHGIIAPTTKAEAAS